MPLPAMPSAQRQDTSLVEGSQPAIISQPHVWIIDDSPTIRAVMSMYLRCHRITVRAFGDGVEAFRHLRQYPGPGDIPSLVLLDIELPRIDGYQVAQTLRALSCCAQTAIVMMSGRDAHLDQIKGRLVGANDYLIKPVTYERLMAVVFAYLGVQMLQRAERQEGSAMYRDDWSRNHCDARHGVR